VLSPLQERIATLVAGLDEAKDFALAGGAALITRGHVQRSTRDLDFFGLSTGDVDRLAPVVVEALLEAGLHVKTVIANPGFVRLEVTSGDETTELDLAADARLLPMVPGPLVPTLADEELAADKVLAVFGRAEARDFADLRAVESLFGLARLCELAKEKDQASLSRCSGTCSVDWDDFEGTSSNLMIRRSRSCEEPSRSGGTRSTC
jgi:hypothetical protein